MRVRLAIAGLAALVVATAACSGSGPGDSVNGETVSGEVYSGEFVQLPADAVVVISLLDTSKQDVAAESISAQRIENPGQLPLEYEVGYDPGDIRPGSIYSIQVTITQGDQLLYINTQAYDVITDGNPRNMDIEVFKIE